MFLKKVKLCILFQVFLACLVVVCLDSMVVWHYLWWLGDSRSMFMFFFPSFWDVYFIDVYLFIFGFGRINLIYCVPLGLSIFSFHMWKYYFGKLVMCKPFNISIDGVGAGLTWTKINGSNNLPHGRPMGHIWELITCWSS